MSKNVFQISIRLMAAAAAMIFFSLPANGSSRFSKAVNVTASVPLILAPRATQEEIVVSGTVVTNTVWSAQNIYHAIGNVVINPGVTLTIEPGVTVKFSEERGLVVRGTLIASGLITAPILFTSDNPPTPSQLEACSLGVLVCSGVWGVQYPTLTKAGIVFAGSKPAVYTTTGEYIGGSIISGTIIEYSYGGISTNSPPHIEGNIFRLNREGVMHGDGLFTRNLVWANTGGFLFNLVGTLQNNYITLNRNAQILIRLGNGKLISNTIESNAAHTIVFLGYRTVDRPLVANNIMNNRATYDVEMGTLAESTFGKVIDGSGNYWGTTDTAIISQRVFDQDDDFGAGVFSFQPVLTESLPVTNPLQKSFLPITLRNTIASMASR